MKTHEQLPIDLYTKEAYRNYAIYVILDRAIPHIEDGLKPVQRRIIYAMSQLGLRDISKPKKSSRTVGDVLGKFHPHGDTACYDAMVLMAQPFSYQHPLIIGQGNWGSVDDPKSFAAMRYTEAKLSKYAQVVLQDLNEATAQWIPNFDGALKEPATLPARLPNILINGASGIAVGMATDIPPHNLKEVTHACIEILKNPDISDDALYQIMPGPDYPTGAEIINSPSELQNIFNTGQGIIRQRATHIYEDSQLIFNELPHQASSSKVIKQISDLVQSKKLSQIKYIRDESDEADPVRIVLVMRSNRCVNEQLMNLLYTNTDLEKTHRVNITYINSNRKPIQTGIRALLSSWVQYREKCVIARITHKLNTVLDRLHVIEGLLTIYDFIDEVIQIIRTEQDPEPKLIKRFSITERQAKTILETKLKQLGQLEEISLRDEATKLKSLKKELSNLISNPSDRCIYIQNELREDIQTHGVGRRSKIIHREVAKNIPASETISKDPCCVIISKKGWVRASKTHDIQPKDVAYKSGDSLSSYVRGYTHWPTILFDDSGYAYSLPTHQLPSVRTHGEPITKYISPNGKITQHLINTHPEQKLFVINNQGYGFICTTQDLISRNKSGKRFISLPEGASIQNISPLKVEDKYLVITTQQGRVLIIELSDVPQLTKGKGNKLIQIQKQDLIEQADQVLHTVSLSDTKSCVLFSGKRKISLSLSEHLGKRGKRGVLLPRGFRKIDSCKAQD